MDLAHEAGGASSAISFADTSVSEVFPTLIWRAHLAPHCYEPLNARLIASLDGMTGPRVQSDRAETFQTEQTLHMRPEFAPLIEAVSKVAAGALRQLAIDYDEIVLSAMWANINPPGTKHSIHSHPNNYFSGVYYLQCDAGAQVVRFHDPRAQAEVIMPPRKQQNIYNGNLVEVATKPGLLVLFPAWLKHDVPINLSKRERISISFDLMFPRFTETMSIPLWEGGANKRNRAS